jgi:uncharacterized protein YifN (PemK superfamily)
MHAGALIMATKNEVHRGIDQALDAGVKAERLVAWAKFEEGLVKDPGIEWQPKPGTILACDFGPGKAQPEMWKERKVVVLSPRIKWKQLCIVVPISGSAPRKRKLYHVELTEEVLDHRFLDEETRTLWAICDCVEHASLRRLRGWHVGGGQRIFHQLPEKTLAEIRLGLVHAIGAGEILDSDEV